MDLAIRHPRPDEDLKSLLAESHAEAFQVRLDPAMTLVIENEGKVVGVAWVADAGPDVDILVHYAARGPLMAWSLLAAVQQFSRGRKKRQLWGWTPEGRLLEAYRRRGVHVGNLCFHFVVKEL